MSTQAKNFAKYGQPTSHNQKKRNAKVLADQAAAKKRDESSEQWRRTYGDLQPGYAGARDRQGSDGRHTGASGTNDVQSIGHHKEQVIDPYKQEQVVERTPVVNPPLLDPVILPEPGPAEQALDSSYGDNVAGIRGYEQDHNDDYWDITSGKKSLAAHLYLDAAGRFKPGFLDSQVGKRIVNTYGQIRPQDLQRVPDSFFSAQKFRDLVPSGTTGDLRDTKEFKDYSTPEGLEYHGNEKRWAELDPKIEKARQNAAQDSTPGHDFKEGTAGKSTVTAAVIGPYPQLTVYDQIAGKTPAVLPAQAAVVPENPEWFEGGEVFGLRPVRSDPLQSFTHGLAGSGLNVYHDVRAIGEGLNTLARDGDYEKGAGEYYQRFHSGDVLDYVFQKGIQEFKGNNKEALERYENSETGLLHNPAWVVGSTIGTVGQFFIPFFNVGKAGLKTAKAVPALAKIPPAVDQKLAAHAAGLFKTPVDLIPELSTQSKRVFTKWHKADTKGSKAQYVSYRSDDFGKIKQGDKVKVDILRPLEESKPTGTIPVTSTVKGKEVTIPHKISDDQIAGKNILFSDRALAGYNKIKSYKSDIVKARPTKDSKSSSFAEMKKYNPDQALGKGNRHTPEFVDLGKKHTSGVFERTNTNLDIVEKLGKDKKPVGRLESYDSVFGKFTENKRIGAVNFFEGIPAKPVTGKTPAGKPSGLDKHSKRDSITANRIRDDLKQDTAVGGPAKPSVILEKHADNILGFTDKPVTKSAGQTQKTRQDGAAFFGTGTAVVRYPPGTSHSLKTDPRQASDLDLGVTPKSDSGHFIDIFEPPVHTPDYDSKLVQDPTQEQTPKVTPDFDQSTRTDTTTKYPPTGDTTTRQRIIIRTPPNRPPFTPVIRPPPRKPPVIPPLLDVPLNDSKYRKGRYSKALKNKGFAGNTFKDHFAGFANRSEITYGAKELSLKSSKRGKEKIGSLSKLKQADKKKSQRQRRFF